MFGGHSLSFYNISKFTKHLQEQRSSRDTLKIKMFLLQFSTLESGMRELMGLTQYEYIAYSGFHKGFLSSCTFHWSYSINLII